MPETPDPDSSLDPTAAEKSWVMIVQVTKSYAGTFEVFVYDPDGVEIVHAPLVPDAETMEGALALFWLRVNGLGPEIASPFN